MEKLILLVSLLVFFIVVASAFVAVLKTLEKSNKLLEQILDQLRQR